MAKGIPSMDGIVSFNIGIPKEKDGQKVFIDSGNLETVMTRVSFITRGGI